MLAFGAVADRDHAAVAAAEAASHDPFDRNLRLPAVLVATCATASSIGSGPHA